MVKLLITQRKRLQSLPLPYNVSHSQDTGFYQFTTDQGVVYVCGFRYATTTLSPLLGIYNLEIYDFEFYPCNPISKSTKNRNDERVSATIIKLLEEFFSNELRVLVYICDSVDGRSKERQLLFNYWYKQLSHLVNRHELEIEREINGQEFTAYGCSLTRKDFPHDDILESELFNKAEGIIVEKSRE